MKDERLRGKETRTTIYTRGPRGLYARGRKMEKSVRRGPGSITGAAVSHYYWLSVRPSVRSWSTVHHTGTLPSEHRSSTWSGIAGLPSRRRSDGEGNQRRLRCCAVSSLSAVQVLSSQSWPRRCNEWKRSGLPGGSRKFNFDRRGDR